MMPYGDIYRVNIGLGNGLLSKETKTLPEPMLTYHIFCPWYSPESNFIRYAQDINHWNVLVCYAYIDGLAQDCSNSSALPMGLLQSCDKPSIWFLPYLLGTNELIIGIYCKWLGI